MEEGRTLTAERLGGGEVTVAHHISEEDRKRGLNRTEYLRVIPYSDPDYARLYALRKDIERINRGIEDTLFLGRAHSVGHAAQLADLLGFAMLTNAVSVFRHRKQLEHLEAA